MKKEGKTVYDFAFGVSPFGPPTCVREALKNATDVHQYAHVQGGH
jgi:histidinol-phosphate/aromatic aminotransferase/cobyric acid decarboxylase-like protein